MKRTLAALAALLWLLAAPVAARDTVVYYHTDALHSVTVVTNAQGQVLERTHYAPYGTVLNRGLRDGPGYTRHQEDAATGLVYMQQRYYDPATGRFLSPDPVQANDKGGSFNRYWYANDNPYRYADPDGRETGIAFHSEFVAMGAQAQTYQAPGDWVGPALKAAFSMLPFIGAGMNAVEAAQNPTAGNVAAVALGIVPVGRVVEEGAKAVKGAAAGERAGKVFTRAGKAEVKDANAAAHGGQTTCASCGRPTSPAQQSRVGVTPPGNETHVDHIIPKSKGGNGSPDNGQVLCRDCNLRKSNHDH